MNADDVRPCGHHAAPPDVARGWVLRAGALSALGGLAGWGGHRALLTGKRRQQRVLPRWTLSGQPPAQPAAHCAQPSCTDDAQSVLFAQVVWSVRLVAFWSCLHFSLFASKIVEMRVLAGGAIE